MAARSRPLRSMTGYGRGAAENRVASAEVELRSVNGKGLAVKWRLPADRLELEPGLDARLRKRLQRGQLQAVLRVRLTSGPAAAIDADLLKRYLREWRRTSRELGLERGDPSLAELLTLPGAVIAPQETAAATRAVERAALAAADQALEQLVASREREGQRLRLELLRLVGRLDDLLDRVRRRLPEASRAAARRLEERVQAAWEAAGVKETLDLARELAVLAERADVQEEVSRLEIHLDGLRRMLEKGGPCGRELDFLILECQREVTTLASKSADARLSQLALAMKGEVQRIREQNANVE